MQGADLAKGVLATDCPLELLHAYIFALAEELPRLSSTKKFDTFLAWVRGVISFPITFVREDVADMRYAAALNARQKLEGIAKVTTLTARQQVHNICQSTKFNESRLTALAMFKNCQWRV